MSNRFLPYAAPGIAGLHPYVPGKPVSELERELGISQSVKLASNENPLGPSPVVVEAIQQELDSLSRYPDGGGFELRQALADKHQLDAGQITLGNGSNDVLDMIARVFLSEQREAVFSEHAFAVYAISTQATGATAKVAPAKDFSHDLDAMLALVNDKTGVVFIANPNNPTGTWLGRADLLKFLQTLPASVIVVIDEAYIEYVDEADYPDASLWLNDFPNLVVTRTFSKAYGLASLRVGYALSHVDIADLLNRVRQPFNVNSMALAAAKAALNDQSHIQRAVELNHQEMAFYEESFSRMGLSWIPSVANFVTVDLQRPAQDVDRQLLSKGIILRPVGNYGLPNHLRISIGLPVENRRCIDALDTVLSG